MPHVVSGPSEQELVHQSHTNILSGWELGGQWYSVDMFKMDVSWIRGDNLKQILLASENRIAFLWYLAAKQYTLHFTNTL